MGDLEHISTSIRKVFDQAARAQEEAERVELAARIRSISAPARTHNEGAMAYAASGGLASSECRPWPHALRSRILQAREAAAALAVDDALRILDELETELGLLDRAYESGSAREAYETWRSQR